MQERPSSIASSHTLEKYKKNMSSHGGSRRNTYRSESFRSMHSLVERPIKPGSSSSHGRLPRLDLEWLLSLEHRRKSERRGSFLSTDDVPRRSVIDQNKIIDYLKSQGFTIGMFLLG